MSATPGFQTLEIKKTHLKLLVQIPQAHSKTAGLVNLEIWISYQS